LLLSISEPSTTIDLVGIIEKCHVLLHMMPLFVAGMLAWHHYEYKTNVKKRAKSTDTVEIAKIDAALQDYKENETQRKLHYILLFLTWLTVHFAFTYFLNVKRIEHDMASISSNLKSVVAKNEYSCADSCIIEGGTEDVYRKIQQVLSSRRSPDEYKEIHILGYTLLTVQPNLEKWIDSGILDNRILYLYYLSPEYIKSDLCIDQEWCEDVNHYLRQIQNTREKNKEIITKNGIDIRLKPYSHLPAIHGFKLGRDKYFVSFSNWEPSGTLSRPILSKYFELDPDNDTEYAKTFKDLFDQWLSKARFETN
jgi:hypothetical protein